MSPLGDSAKAAAGPCNERARLPSGATIWMPAESRKQIHSPEDAHSIVVSEPPPAVTRMGGPPPPNGAFAISHFWSKNLAYATQLPSGDHAGPCWSELSCSRGTSAPPDMFEI